MACSLLSSSRLRWGWKISSQRKCKLSGVLASFPYQGSHYYSTYFCFSFLPSFLLVWSTLCLWWMWLLCRIKARGCGLRSDSWRKRWHLWASLRLLTQVAPSLCSREKCSVYILTANSEILISKSLWQFQTLRSKRTAAILVPVRSRLTQSTGRGAPSYSQALLLQDPPSRPPAALQGSRWAKDSLRCLEVSWAGKWSYTSLIVLSF